MPSSESRKNCTAASWGWTDRSVRYFAGELGSLPAPVTTLRNVAAPPKRGFLQMVEIRASFLRAARWWSHAVMKHVSVKILPALNGAAMQPAWRARASRRTGGKLIMWKMRAVASVPGADGDHWGASTLRSQVLAWLGTKPAPRSSITGASLPSLSVTPLQLYFLSSVGWKKWADHLWKPNLLLRQPLSVLIKVPRETLVLYARRPRQKWNK